MLKVSQTILIFIYSFRFLSFLLIHKNIISISGIMLSSYPSSPSFVHLLTCNYLEWSSRAAEYNNRKYRIDKQTPHEKLQQQLLQQ